MFLAKTSSARPGWREALINVKREMVIRTPRYMIQDRDGAFEAEFTRRAWSMGIRQVLISARSPWHKPYVEQVIGWIRWECLDHVIIFSEQHLRRVLREYIRSYHGSRTHLELAKDCPHPRRAEPPHLGVIQTEPMVGGLHHRYHHRYFRYAA